MKLIWRLEVCTKFSTFQTLILPIAKYQLFSTTDLCFVDRFKTLNIKLNLSQLEKKSADNTNSLTVIVKHIF